MKFGPFSVVILAAGKGSRMHTKTPKPLIPFAGKPILNHLVTTCEQLNPQQIIVVYSGDHKIFSEAIGRPNVTWVEQKEPLGTAHAVQCTLPYISTPQTLVLCGDTPLITRNTLSDLLSAAPTSLGLISAIVDEPTGFGRIIRDKNQALRAIIEEKDADSCQRAICEISSGIITAPTAFLQSTLKHISNDNAQKEYYLPDIIPLWLQRGNDVITVCARDAQSILGVNTWAQHAELERLFQQQVAQTLMDKGVCITHPHQFNCQGHIKAEPGVYIGNNVTVKGEVVIKSGASIGANTILENATIGENATIHPNSIITNSHIDAHASIGPFAYIRPGSHIGEQAKAGAFVEIKNSHIGAHSKASHLSYIGDASVGMHVNIGAGTITCNYDGTHKHTTEINHGAFIGSGTQLVAPVQIGENSYIGAGSCITENTPENKLVLARSRQTVIAHWKPKVTEVE